MTPAITLGNWLTLAAVFISLLALLLSFWMAHRQNNKTIRDAEQLAIARMAVLEQKVDTLYNWWERTWKPLSRSSETGD